MEEIASSDAQMTDYDILTQQQDYESGNDNDNVNNNNNDENGSFCVIERQSPNKDKKEIDTDDSDDGDDIENVAELKDLTLDKLESRCIKVATELVDKEGYLDFRSTNVCNKRNLFPFVRCNI